VEVIVTDTLHQDELTWDVGKISQQGIYAKIPMSVYHSDCCVGPSISSSGLREIAQGE